ncbi:hypothetical protein, partial [Luteococcus sp.]|uniref:hypothetical protein n=1 Tax=Luteococcus sp. TaxID=1969402 RepID=UPI003735BBA0
GTSIYFSYVAASVTDPWIAEALTEARRGVQTEVGQCLRAQGATIEDIDGAALDLTLMAEGATQAIFVGWCTPEEALARIRHALARLGVTIS